MQDVSGRQLDTEAIAEPLALLELAQELEPWTRFAERTAALDRLDQLLQGDTAMPAPEGRDWELELMAERVIDIARAFQTREAVELADEVIARANVTHESAIARALLGKGQALAWTGTESSIRESDRTFREAANRFKALGRPDWQGSALIRCGYSTHYQYGDLTGAEELIRQALACWETGSQRYAGALDCYADVLIDLGELDRAELVLDEEEHLGNISGDPHLPVTIAQARGRIAAARDDAAATERIFYEAELAAAGTDWHETLAGGALMLEAAECLDQLGLRRQANAYLKRSEPWAVGGVPTEDEAYMAVRATMLARSGDPEQALEELQSLYRRDWLQKRLLWRHTLMTAWATLRAGNPHDAGVLAARALAQAASAGSVKVALTAEPEITRALAPLAEQAGSSHARELLLADRQFLVRLFGTPSVTTADGTAITLPAGKPGELARWLALTPHGVPLDVVLETFFPESAPDSGRARLRQVLTRLRRTAGDLVIRDGETLKLAPAWIDLSEFLLLAGRLRGAREARAQLLAHAGLILHVGPLLPSDLYAEWADAVRDEVEQHHERMLELANTYYD